MRRVKVRKLAKNAWPNLAENKIKVNKSKFVTLEQKKQSVTITEKEQHNLLRASLELIKTVEQKLCFCHRVKQYGKFVCGFKFKVSFLSTLECSKLEILRK